MQQKESFMDVENSELNEQQLEDLPKLYSRNSVLFFSIFFSSIFGAFLVVSNLFRIGNKSAARMLLVFSSFYFALTVVLALLTAKPIALLTLAMNYIGGALLADYFQPKLIPGFKKYPTKSFLIPLLISLLLSIALIVFSWNQIMQDVSKVNP